MALFVEKSRKKKKEKMAGGCRSGPPGAIADEGGSFPLSAHTLRKGAAEMEHLPENIWSILNRLREAGYEAYAVGGCVRDALLGREPHDWDVCTSALPTETIAVFSDCTVHTVGIQHGTVLVMINGEGVEVTTYRTEGAYTDHRRPDSVTFVRSLREDLARRDFTINAMAWNPWEGLRDFYSGAEDLKKGIIRCVGQPERRFEEDGLRILRGLRFSARFGFPIEEETGRAILQKAPLLDHIAGERIYSELKGFFSGSYAARLMREYQEVFGVLFPELRPMFDHPQYNHHHIYDVWGHTCKAVENVSGDWLLGLVMLFHDSGKPSRFTRDSNGVGHFKGHPEESAKIAEACLKRLHCDNKTLETVLMLIRWHDRMRIFTRRNTKRMLAELGEERTRLLLRVIEADVRAQNPELLPGKLEALEEGRRIVEELLAEGACLSVRDLAVSGRDLLAMGMPPGKAVGAYLNALLEAVLEEELPNEREALLDAASKSMQKSM